MLKTAAASTLWNLFHHWWKPRCWQRCPWQLWVGTPLGLSPRFPLLPAALGTSELQPAPIFTLSSWLCVFASSLPCISYRPCSLSLEPIWVQDNLRAASVTWLHLQRTLSQQDHILRCSDITSGGCSPAHSDTSTTAGLQSHPCVPTDCCRPPPIPLRPESLWGSLFCHRA